MVFNKTYLVGALLFMGLTACLDSSNKSTSSENGSSAEPSGISTVMMSSVSVDKNCNPGKQGAIVYDSEKSQFFFCNDSQWSAIDLRGPKGEKGDSGVSGANGATGLNGANGQNGKDGRDGIDGDGVRLALKENGQVKGILVQYEANYQNEGQLALMMFPNGDVIYIDVVTGNYSGKPWNVYYTDSDCKGTAYTGRTDAMGPNSIGRIYVGSTNNGQNSIFTSYYYYRAEENLVGTNIYSKSYRSYSTLGSFHTCVNNESSHGVLVRVTEIPAPPSLKHLAPIRFSP